MTPARGLVLVSAGLSLRGGGTARVGRLLCRGAAAYAAARSLPFRVLHLGSALGSAEALEELPIEHFAGSTRRLALALWRRQLGRAYPALVYDFLGPARVQAMLPRRARSPYLVFLHGIEAWRKLTWDRRRALDNAAVLLANSDYTRQRARRFHPLPGAEVLPLALEEVPAPGEPDRDLLERLGQGYILIVGRMAESERYKGHDELLDALRLVLHSRPGTRLVIAGDGDDRPRLQARRAALGLDEAVAFTGFISEATLAELYRRAAVFAMPSRDEGFGLVYLEAMRAGRPCVALRGTAAAEVVRDGETGLLVDGGPEALAAALLRLLDDPDLGARLGAAGCDRWQRELSAPAFHRRLDTHLDRLLDARR
ncbi:MAG TPA: glycosyltransferase [Thermoanaerobaculia bacterium]|nr:glycosyltransferase [Thermoanaerobaculia bacterium]